MPGDGKSPPWSAEEDAIVRDNPTYAGARAAGLGRSEWAYEHRRARHNRLKRRDVPAVDRLPEVEWDKHDADFHWTDVLGPLTALQEVAKRSSGSQDFATVRLIVDRPTPVLFISDWHIGSWGISYRRLAGYGKAIQAFGMHVACLGDMLQMAIKLRNVLEMSDNALPPRLQDRFLESWLGDFWPHVLWSTHDNHSVERQEQATGFSHYAELFKEKTIYHSGIGHIDLELGEQTYKIASAHRFRGNSFLNPVHGQMRYMRMEGIDREISVAGDSHKPGITAYYDGPQARLAINCGTLQTDSGYAKRYFSLFTHDAFPVVVFHPDRHVAIPFLSLQHYAATYGLELPEELLDGTP